MIWLRWLPCFACIGVAGALIWSGQEGRGWFLFVAVLLA